jgi:uroporphyrinogen-III synthase
MQVPIWVIVPEPNTWRETLAAIDARADDRPLRGAHVAVQEYGVSNDELLDGLAERGARVLQVRVYRWALPEDLTPLKRAVGAIADGQVDVIVFTTSVQVVHLWQVLQDMDADAAVRRGLASMLVASIGPTTSEELRRHQIDVDLEASHPRFGVLIRELAERSAPLLQAKRNRA